MGAILGFFTGGANIWLKVASVLGVLLVLGGGFGYVYYLRTSLTIAKQEIVVVKSALDAEKQKSTMLLNDVHVMQNLNSNIQIEWKGLDLGKITFVETVKKKVDTAVTELKKSPESEAARVNVENSVNALSNASNRCSEIAVSGATAEDKSNQDVKDLCPELVK